MNAQYPVSLGIRDELNEALSVEVGLRSRVGRERKLSDIVLDVSCLELLLVLANPGDFGVSVHDRGDGAVVDMAVTLADVLDNGDGLLLSLVGQHGSESNVTNGTDVRDLGTVFLVDDHTATLVNLKANVLKTKAVGVWTATDGNEDNVSIEGLLFSALGGLNSDLDALALGITSGDLGVELELHALLLEKLLRLLCDVLVHTRAANLAQVLNDGDLRAKARPHGGHLKTDDTTANDGHLLRNFLQGDSASARDDLLLIDGQSGEGRSLGSSGDEDVLSADSGLAAFNEVDRNGVLVLESASSLDVLDVVLLEQELNTLCQTSDRGVLCLHHRREVELDISDLDTAVLGVVQDLVVEVRVVKEGLRGDAANVQAGSAEGSALLNTRDLVAVSSYSVCLRPCSRTFMPDWPALIAATYPATPPPMMTRSFSSISN